MFIRNVIYAVLASIVMLAYAALAMPALEIRAPEPDGVVVAYQNTVKRDIPVEDAVMAPDGNIVPFKNTGKRDIPVEDAVMAPDGNIVPFQNIP